MTHLPDPADGQERSATALSSVLAAIFLTALKLAVGLLTGSLGILADPKLPIGQAHQLSEQLKRQLLARKAGIHDVLIHLAPEGEEG